MNNHYTTKKKRSTILKACNFHHFYKESRKLIPASLLRKLHAIGLQLHKKKDSSTGVFLSN